MGMAIYQPNLDMHRVSPIAEAFCRLLIKQYRVNLFDQLVFQNADIVVHDKEKEVEMSYEVLTVKWFDLCMACSSGDLVKVCVCVRVRVCVRACLCVCVCVCVHA
jgi:hypothetical protein